MFCVSHWASKFRTSTIVSIDVRANWADKKKPEGCQAALGPGVVTGIISSSGGPFFTTFELKRTSLIDKRIWSSFFYILVVSYQSASVSFRDRGNPYENSSDFWDISADEPCRGYVALSLKTIKAHQKFFSGDSLVLALVCLSFALVLMVHSNFDQWLFRSLWLPSFQVLTSLPDIPWV